MVLDGGGDQRRGRHNADRRGERGEREMRGYIPRVFSQFPILE